MSSITIVSDGITRVHTTAVVNAANEGLWQGSGVCGAIFAAAGPQKLKKACDAIGRCDTGSAVITPAFDLAGSDYIIHAVGPVWRGGQNNEAKLLYGAYRSSLELAAKNNCKSIGFPLISAGIFGYPLEKAWNVALSACSDFISENPNFDIEIKFAVPSEENRNTGERLLAHFQKSGI
ncbi:MAG: macro domain-containing protein [Clostridia bacterium]|nr:macro domain-containing protein [Clostridia bacterium]